MISYAPFYKTLKKSGITEYSLIFHHGIDPKILHRMKHGEAITTKTLNKLCIALNCEVSEIIVYKKNPEVSS